MKQQIQESVDTMASWQNGKLTKCQVGEMTKLQVGKMANDKVELWREEVSWRKHK